jgi:hypothetical protein
MKMEMNVTTQQPKPIRLGNVGPVLIEANGAQVVIEADGRFHATNDSAEKPAPEIGAIETAGEHKGEIYGGIYPADNKPIWFSAAPKLMNHYKAAAWAEEQGGSLPTRKQGDYLTTLKDKGGAFTELFNRGGSFPAGYVWLAKPNFLIRDIAWFQRLSDGAQLNGVHRNEELPILSVRR